MMKRKSLKGGMRRHTIESDDEDDDFFLDEDLTSSTDSTTAGVELDEPFVKRQKGTKKVSSRKPVSRQFMESFITEFSADELAAKRTVETIYGGSGSFAYTFRCLEETVLAGEGNNGLILSFIKALAAVADENMLRNMLGVRMPAKKAYTAPVAPTETPASESYEFLIVGTVKKLKDLISIDENATGWEKIMSYAKCLLLNGLSRELRFLMASFFGEQEISAESISSALNRFKGVISTVQKLGSTHRVMARSTKQPLGMSDCIDVIEQLKDILGFLKNAQRIVATTVANRTESEGIMALLEAIELELCIAGSVATGGNGQGNKEETTSINSMDVDPPSASGDHTKDVYYKIECLRLLLSDDCCSCLSGTDILSESDFLRQKLDNMCQSFEESLQRQKEQQAELARKCKLKRDAITYVLNRLSESESPNAPASIRHPYYILGIPPSRCSEDVLRKYGRKLKTLLHPDTEHDPEWKPRAEQAFKEASIALEKCASLGGVIPNYGNVKLAPQPPYACFIGLVAQTESQPEATSTTVPASDNALEIPTMTLLPSFVTSCTDNKSGAVSISVEPSIFTMNGFKKLGNNKHVVVYMHRPTHGDEPTSLSIHHSYIYVKKRVPLSESSNSKHVNIKIEAVQPIVFGSAWRYFVGVQVVGDLGASLVSWRSVYVELSTKGRTAGHVGKLLATFEGAQFVNQSLLQAHLARCREGSKTEAEPFLIDCAKAAQRWADVH